MEYINNEAKKIFTDNEKEKICKKVKALIDSGKEKNEAIKEIAKENGIHPHTIVRYDKKYRKFSSEVKKDWNEDEKETICQKVKNLIDSGEGVLKARKKIAEEYGICPDTISSWDKKYRKFSSEVKKDWNEDEQITICQKVKDLIQEKGRKLITIDGTQTFAIKPGITKEEALEIVAEENGIHPNTITRWDKKYRRFSTKFEGKKHTKQEKIDICNAVKYGMEATGKPAMGVIAGILARINGIDVLEQYYLHAGEFNNVYEWNRKLKIFDTQDRGGVSKYSNDRKREILEEVNNLIASGKGKTKAKREVEKTHNLGETTLYNWNKELKVFKSKDEIIKEATKKILAKLEQENKTSEIIKNTGKDER